MLSPQEVEEEEPAEHYSDEEAPPATGEPVPPAANSPAKEEEEEEAEVKEEDSQSKEESKSEEKGNLAGERQSGDGQVSLDGLWTFVSEQKVRLEWVCCHLVVQCGERGPALEKAGV